MKDLVGYLSSKRYPGRGILFGVTLDENYAAAAYFIMGRSANSRNRVFVETEDGVLARAYDEALVTDPSLILYTPIRHHKNSLIVSNGDQTDTIYSFLSNGGSFHSALLTRAYEPDAPHYTPRISGLLHMNRNSASYMLSILRKEPATMDCARDIYEYAQPPAGTGHLIHTYEEGGDPLKTFSGEPVAVMLPEGPAEHFTDVVWNSLDEENRISLCVFFMPLSGGEPFTILRNAHIR